MTTAPAPPYTPPSIGDIVYLASALFRVRVGAITTPPDTPNQYTADIKVMGDQGDMSLDNIRGPTGPAGQQTFAFRRQDDANVNSSADLPTNLTNSPEDIGKYWLIDTVDQGVVTMETAWTWYGTGWRTFMMGTFGPPGPMPDITVGVQNIDPKEDAYVDGGGSTVQPTWELYLPQPAGIPGKVTPLYVFPDVDEHTTAPVQYDLLAYLGKQNPQGQAIWEPLSIQQLLPQPWSMPESAFSAYSGFAQQAFIGSFAVPPQSFDWTPVVWGHLGGSTVKSTGITNSQQLIQVNAQGGTFTLGLDGIYTPPLPWNSTTSQIATALQNLENIGAGALSAIEHVAGSLVEFIGGLAGTAVSTITADVSNLLPAGIGDVLVSVLSAGGLPISNLQSLLSGDPLRVGCQVLLGDPVNGTQVARGIGSLLGRCVVVPHYSTTRTKTKAITPSNNYAVVPAHHTGNQGTVYINLWNDGMLGSYNFNPQGAQLYVQAVPVEIAQQLGSHP